MQDKYTDVSTRKTFPCYAVIMIESVISKPNHVIDFYSGNIWPRFISLRSQPE